MEDSWLTWVLAISIGLLVFAGLGSWVAAQKSRSPAEGLVLGLVFGPLGVIVEALLPGGDPERPACRRRSRLRDEEDEGAGDQAVSRYLAERARGD